MYEDANGRERRAQDDSARRVTQKRARRCALERAKARERESTRARATATRRWCVPYIGARATHATKASARGQGPWKVVDTTGAWTTVYMVSLLLSFLGLFLINGEYNNIRNDLIKSIN